MVGVGQRGGRRTCGGGRSPNDSKSRRTPCSSIRRRRNEEADDYGETIAKTWHVQIR